MRRWTCAGLALVCALTGCSFDAGDDRWDVGLGEDESSVPPASPPPLALDADEQRGLDRLHALIREADALSEQPRLSDTHRRALATAIADLRRSKAHFVRLRRHGSERSEQLASVGLAAGWLLANDVTGVGVADDPLLVVCGVTALVIVATTDGAATKSALDGAFERLRGDAVTLQAAVRDATAATASEEVCSLPRSVPGLPPLPRRDSRPDDRETADVAPLPAQRDAPDRPRRETCAQALPHLLRCDALPGAYMFKNQHAALREMKRATGNASLTLRKRERTDQPPCVDQGWHINVRAGGQRAGSLTSCSCCQDTAARPREEERWRIVW